MKKKTESKVDHCAIDPHFESMTWYFLPPAHTEPTRSPELWFWRKLIAKAISDLSSVEEYHRADARRWFLRAHRDYRFVCQLAEIDYRALQQIIIEAVDNPLKLKELHDRIVKA